MRSWAAGAASAFMLIVGAITAWTTMQAPAVESVSDDALRAYAGTYRSDDGDYLHLQLWNEFTGKNQLVAFEESGEVRTLYPTAADRFFTGPSAAVSSSVESSVQFQRDAAGRPASFVQSRDGSTPRTARRAPVDEQEEIAFSNGAVRLAGSLISPAAPGGKRPAVVLVHGSGPESREYVLPFARFLVRRGIAILTYDKRGVGGSTGDWNTASFADLAGDVVAACAYLKSRPDIDASRIGLLGISQAGWVMPLAAERVPDLAFLISVSGAGVSPAETTLDQARNEMTAAGMKPQVVDQIVSLMTLQYRFAESGEGWEEYASMREQIAARLGGRPPETFPGTKDHPAWQTIRRLYFHDPGPALRQLKVPTLAIFGELDNNIIAAKNTAAWEAALKAGGHRDYAIRVLPKGNHLQLEAKIGSIAEMPSLTRFVPQYFTTIEAWLAPRIPGWRDGKPIQAAESR